MTFDQSKVVERSVDSLQRIYAVVIALAVSQAIQSLLKDPTGGNSFDKQRIVAAIPALVAFLFTVVPFWHGMNRHLDHSYLKEPGTAVHGALLFDFAAFFLEAIFLFAAAWSLAVGIDTFIFIAALLLTDVIWGWVSHLIHSRGKESHSMKWALINLVAIFVGILVVEFPFNSKPWVLMSIAIGRSIADYWLGYGFYFAIDKGSAAAAA